MYTATGEVGVGEEAFDTGERLEEEYELTTVHLAERHWNLGVVMLVATAVILVVADNPGDLIRTGKAAESERARSTLMKSSSTMCGKGPATWYRAGFVNRVNCEPRVARVVEFSPKA